MISVYCAWHQLQQKCIVQTQTNNVFILSLLSDLGLRSQLGVMVLTLTLLCLWLSAPTPLVPTEDVNLKKQLNNTVSVSHSGFFHWRALQYSTTKAGQFVLHFDSFISSGKRPKIQRHGQRGNTEEMLYFLAPHTYNMYISTCCERVRAVKDRTIPKQALTLYQFASSCMFCVIYTLYDSDGGTIALLCLHVCVYCTCRLRGIYFYERFKNCIIYWHCINWSS